MYCVYSISIHQVQSILVPYYILVDSSHSWRFDAAFVFCFSHLPLPMLILLAWRLRHGRRWNRWGSAGYSEVQQNNFLLNFYSLATTFSALHAPIPRARYRFVGFRGVWNAQLKCEQRLVLSYTKTEDTNKTPILPRPRGSFAFPSIDLSNGKSIVPYAGFGYVPPVPIGGTRNVMISMEAGAGYADLAEGKWQTGIRYHATLMRTIVSDTI